MSQQEVVRAVACTLITEEMKEKYAATLMEKGYQQAQDYAREIISGFGISDTTARGQCWNAIKEIGSKAWAEKEKASEKAKREAARQKRTIAKVVTELLTKPLNPSEQSFLVDIKSKRKLTEKQSKWLNSICTKNSVAKAEFEQRASVQRISPSHCEHEDLGSLGYTHGTIVTCPYCGGRAEVW